MQMDDKESMYGTMAMGGGGPMSEISMRRRSLPKHPKGFNNDWGALLQH